MHALQVTEHATVFEVGMSECHNGAEKYQVRGKLKRNMSADFKHHAQYM